MSKGDSRRPTDKRHVQRCGAVGHVWLGERCFRCAAPRTVYVCGECCGRGFVFDDADDPVDCPTCEGRSYVLTDPYRKAG